jgi:hypothetical protein
MSEIDFKAGNKYQLMFPEVGDCFFYNGNFVYVTEEVANDGAYLSNGDFFMVGDWIRRVQLKEKGDV